jgi:hypothetical protein
MVPHGREVLLAERVDGPHPVRGVALLGARAAMGLLGPVHGMHEGDECEAAVRILQATQPVSGEGETVVGVTTE